MMSKFHGVTSALVTPFLNNEVDYQSLEKLVNYQIENGINGLVVNGTTAESPTLTSAEVEKIFKTVRQIVGKEFPLILGTGSNSTAQTILSTKSAEKLGADAALVVVPYYNKPPQRGLVSHFEAVANSSSTPVILYNVPGRTITGMTTETILQLSENKNIIGIKEASGDVAFDQKIKSQVRKDFILLSGDDGTYIDFLKMGGNGIISVMSNLITAKCAEWTKQASEKAFEIAAADFEKHRALINAMYVEANPIPIKWMLYKKNIIKSPEMRLPLCTLDEKFYPELTNLMKQTGLL